MELVKERAIVEEEEEKEPERGLDVKTLSEVFSSNDHTMELLKERDANPARSGAAAHAVGQAMKMYREIFNTKKKLEDRQQSPASSNLLPPQPVRHPRACPTLTTHPSLPSQRMRMTSDRSMPLNVP
ncbi:hypothetical protein Pcinc_024545 [Petrolisthes cinctipes]|uniref:Uncharacterized protein n=1 Tax=Petrolisthes cinctipes TaxID=88211 RepID=A0AAE1FB56_PETCI|nr:hypothetical protein Pcinc_024545 [Petrolisthes cinctipes]